MNNMFHIEDKSSVFKENMIFNLTMNITIWLSGFIELQAQGTVFETNK